MFYKSFIYSHTCNSLFVNTVKTYRMDVTILREALQTVPNHNCELVVKAIAEKLANTLGEQVYFII